eukprot:jgi/Botrbrau1/13339/Bobra.0334s0015.1
MKKAIGQFSQLAEHERYFECDTEEDRLSRILQEAGTQFGWFWGVQKPTPPALTQLSEPAQLQGAKGPPPPATAESQEQEITLEQFKEQLAHIDKTLRFLPATAQVASQQGRYLAGLFNRYHVGAPVPNTVNGLPADAPPFRYKHLGAFAYVGSDAAVLETPSDEHKKNIWTGWTTGLLWKSSETWMQFSWKNKYLVSRDWLKSKVFGRDISDVGGA